jgi:hypothetical protein
MVWIDNVSDFSMHINDEVHKESMTGHDIL